jgi:hypothetical protein
MIEIKAFSQNFIVYNHPKFGSLNILEFENHAHIATYGLIEFFKTEDVEKEVKKGLKKLEIEDHIKKFSYEQLTKFLKKEEIDFLLEHDPVFKRKKVCVYLTLLGLDNFVEKNILKGSQDYMMWVERLPLCFYYQCQDNLEDIL